MKIALYISIVILILASCEIKPATIEYGKVECQYCSMTIVDKGHAALYVTTKGKNYFFDSIECMYFDIHEEEEVKELAYIMVVDYSNPGTMIVAKEAIFIIDPEIPSPMGKNLSAFSKTYDMKKVGSNNKEIYSWDNLILTK